MNRIELPKIEDLHSDTEWSCEDYCIYDAGTNCIKCERFTNTVFYKTVEAIR